jgi:thioredoxin reductase (NADPH)
MDLDVIIIGGGAAGLSASVWCEELGLSALLLEAGEELGGQLLYVYNEIKDHLGIEAKNGREMRDVFVKQAQKSRFNYRLDSEVLTIDPEKKTISLKGGETFSARTFMIATGVRRRKLNVAGEEIFKNKGILESGSRDKELVKGKKVLIVGGGDAAFENALILSETASEVTLVHRGKDFRARADFIEKAGNRPKIKILTETVLREIIGSDDLEVVKLENVKTGETFYLPVEAMLIRIGVEPNTDFLRGKIELDESGYIKVNDLCETSVEGIFAVGDVANRNAPTVSGAVGMGATAAKTVSGWLKAVGSKI